MTDAPTPNAADEPAIDARPPSRVTQAIVVLTISVALAMVALIYVQWLNYSEPSSMVVVEGDATADGVVVDISRVRADGKLYRTVQIQLGEQNAYSASYFLEAGEYQVTAARGTSVYLSFPVVLRENRAYRTSLVGRVPTTATTATGTMGGTGRSPTP